MTKVKAGTRAPAFSLPDDRGKTRRLSEWKGKWVLLYFYPKDDTPGCTIEACALRDQFKDFKRVKAEVIGVSIDGVLSHRKFKQAYQLPFTLLADEEKEVVRRYSVWGKKSMYGKSFMGTRRTSFLIDPRGFVRKVYEKVKPETHAAEVVADLAVFMHG